MYGTRKFGNDGTQKIWGPASKCAGTLASPGGTCVSSCIGRSPLWGHPSTPLRGSERRCRESNVRSHLERQELRHTLKQPLVQRTYSCALKHLSASNLLVSEGRNKSQLRWPPTKHQAKHSHTAKQSPGIHPKGAKDLGACFKVRRTSCLSRWHLR